MNWNSLGSLKSAPHKLKKEKLESCKDKRVLISIDSKKSISLQKEIFYLPVLPHLSG